MRSDQARVNFGEMVSFGEIKIRRKAASQLMQFFDAKFVNVLFMVTSPGGGKWAPLSLESPL
jgi:hypothetical protein